MKSRPEYRPVFSSNSAFFRAIHIISTQRYRLPVRRYILDLFEIELDADIAHSLSECSRNLRAPVCFKPSDTAPERVVSMFGHLGRPRRTSESDDEDELDMMGDERPFIEEPPAISLRPMSRIVGFTS
jgi:rapamycin-insensitive companion of mTOR